MDCPKPSIWKFLFGYERSEEKPVLEPVEPAEIIESIKSIVFDKPVESTKSTKSTNIVHTEKIPTKSLIRANRNVLEEYFQCNPRPNKIEITQLAEKIGTDVTSVKRWFYNSRSRRRVRFTENEEIIMRDVLGNRRYVTKDEELALAIKFGINVRYVAYWFANYRKYNMVKVNK